MAGKRECLLALTCRYNILAHSVMANSTKSQWAERFKLPLKAIAFRRWIIGSLATRERIGARTKLLIAISLFVVSYVTKSLHAVDFAPKMYTMEQDFGGLTDTYDERAVLITEGKGLLGPYDVNPRITVWIAQAPAYSIFLSAVYSVVGRDFFKVQLVQNGVNSLSPILIFLIAGTIVSWRVGAVTGFLAALSHHLSYISNFILPDSLSALPLLAAIYLLVLARAHRRHGYLLYAMAGVMIGLSAWVRSQTMLFGLFLIVMLAIIYGPRRDTFKRALLMAAVSLLTIAPITIKNYIVYGELVPVNIGMGIVLWEGIGETERGKEFGAVAKDEEVAIQDAEIYGKPRYAGSWSTPDGIMRDRDRVKRSIGIIARHPVWYSGVMLKRMAGTLKYSAHAPLVYRNSEVNPYEKTGAIRKGWEPLATDGASSLKVGESLRWTRPAVRAAQRVTKETMLAFVILGVVLMLIASRRRSLLLLTVPIYYWLFQCFMHTEFRYTLPMHYFLFVFAAIIWVLIGVAVWNGLKSLTAKARKRKIA
jgi:hypothetical protein